MKKGLLFLAAMLIMFSFSAFAQGDKPARPDLEIGSAMPVFTIESAVHGKINSVDLKGKVVLINLFATWCPPCQKELAEVKDVLWPKYKDNKNFKMLTVYYGSDALAVPLNNKSNYKEVIQDVSKFIRRKRSVIE